jgi:hypothetical protein
MTMQFPTPIWRPYYEIRSNTEASIASASSSFSLSTLEITTNPGMAIFALTERKQPYMWRWATISVEGPVVDEGWESTQEDAKRSAIDALDANRSVVDPLRHVTAE